MHAVTLFCETEDATTESLMNTYDAFKRQTFASWQWLLPEEIYFSLPDLHDDSRVLPSMAETFENFIKLANKFTLFFDLEHLILPTTLEKFVWYLLTNKEVAFVRGMKSYDFEVYDIHKHTNDVDYFPIPYLYRTSVLHNVIAENEIDIDAMPFSLRHWVLQISALKAGKRGAFLPEIIELAIHRRNLFTDEFEDGDTKKEILGLINFSTSDVTKKNDKEFANIDYSALTTELTTEVPIKWTSHLPEDATHILILLNSFENSDVNRSVLDMVREIASRAENPIYYTGEKNNFVFSVISTFDADNQLLPKFLEITEDIFILRNLLRNENYPGFISLVISSRRPKYVINAESSITYQLLPYLKPIYNNAKFIDYIYTMKPKNFCENFSKLSVTYQNFIDYTFTSAESLCKNLIKMGKDPKRVSMLRQGIDINNLSLSELGKNEILHKYKIPSDSRYILYNERINYNYNTEKLVETIKKLNSKKLKYHLLVASDGVDYDRFINDLDENNIENVLLLGNLSERNFIDILTIADVIILTGYSEEKFNLVCKAMALQTAIVCPDLNNSNFIIDSDCGTLIPADEIDSSAYANYLERYITEPELANNHAINGRNKIYNSFKIDSQVDQFLTKIGNIKPQKQQEQNNLQNELMQIFLSEVSAKNKLLTDFKSNLTKLTNQKQKKQSPTTNPQNNSQKPIRIIPQFN